MRMWMVNPKFMCRKHLLGEHVELHMFAGSINKNVGIDGYVKNNLVEPLKFHERHDELVKEMGARGMNHKSPLVEINMDNIKEHINATVDIDSSLQDLLSRCPECNRRYNEIMKESIAC